jgi:hypothetical protein
MTNWEMLQRDYKELCKSVLKLADKAQRSHDLALRAHYRYMNCQGGTATGLRAHDSYVRHAEAFEAAIAELKKLTN